MLIFDISQINFDNMLIKKQTFKQTLYIDDLFYEVIMLLFEKGQIDEYIKFECNLGEGARTQRLDIARLRLLYAGLL